MTDADDLHYKLNRLRTLMDVISVSAKGVSGDILEALASIRLATESLESAVRYAAQGTDATIAVENILDQMLEGSMNTDILVADDKVRAIVRDLEDIKNQLPYQAGNLQKFTLILTKRFLPMSGAQLVVIKQVNDLLDQLETNL